MKTLKKTLSLTLVFALVFSLMSMAFAAETTTTSTTTTGYKDAADITYKEAVDVTSAIGVFQGNDLGAFAPKDNLTREQAAKIICYVSMGKTAADALRATSAPFTDVPASRWSAGSIAYCAKQGIVAGYGDGKFGPNDTVTGYQFAKMLLVALGYDATIEQFNGSDWFINVAKRAFANKLFSGNSAFVGTNNVTREESALYTFNMINKVNVTYASRGTEIKLADGTVIRQGASAPSQDAANGTYRSTHFPSLSKSTVVTNDAYGRPAATWKYGTTTIGTYTNDTAVASWTDDHSDVANDTAVAKALSGYTYAAATGLLYTNGNLTSSNNTFTANSIAALTGNGVKVEVYADANDVINRVVVIKTVLASCINKDTVNKTITLSDGTNSVKLTATSDTDAYGTAYTALYGIMNVGDAALVVEQTSGTSISAILSYAAPTVVSGVITGKTAGTTVNTNVYTIGGKTYQAGNGASAALINSLTLGTTAYRFVIDSYGYIKYADTNTTASLTYAFVLDTSRDGSAMAGYTYNAKLLLADGSMKWVKMASYAGSTDETTLNAALTSAKNAFVPYTSNTDGSYAIGTAVTPDSLNGKTVTNNSATFNSKLVSGTTTFLIYNSTTKTFAPYTGISNVPTTNITTGYGLVSNGVYKFVVITDSTATSADVVFIYDTTATSTNYVNSVLVDTYDALVNGTLSTVKVVDGQVTTQGIKIGSQYSSGVISTIGTDTAATNALNDSVTLSKTTYATNPVQKVALTAQDITLTDGVLTVANGTGKITGLVNSSFVCYVMSDGAKTCSVKSLSSTAYSATGTLYLVLDSNGYVAYAILEVA